MSDQPILPYGGNTEPNSGHAGSEASRDRARTEDADGTTSYRQRKVRMFIEAAGERGMTWAEVAEACRLHHGQASGALSSLHRAGKIARLNERRNRCSVYVMPDQVAGREAVLSGVTSTTALLGDMAALLTRFSHNCVHTPFSDPHCIQCETREVLRRYEART